MPLLNDGLILIRKNLEEIQKMVRVKPVIIGHLTSTQLQAINLERSREGQPPIIEEVIFLGKHIYQSRIARDGYTIEDVLDQIASALDSTAIVIASLKMTAIENPTPRADSYGNRVRDRAIFECTSRHPRPELYSVIPKGDVIKPKSPC